MVTHTEAIYRIKRLHHMGSTQRKERGHTRRGDTHGVGAYTRWDIHGKGTTEKRYIRKWASILHVLPSQCFFFLIFLLNFLPSQCSSFLMSSLLNVLTSQFSPFLISSLLNIILFQYSFLSISSILISSLFNILPSHCPCFSISFYILFSQCLPSQCRPLLMFPPFSTRGSTR